MRRDEFLKKMTLAGAGMYLLPSLFTACSKEEITKNFDGKVIIVGGGAAGMFAAYTLAHFGVEFELLEANSVLGGRVKKSSDFADFPIDIGAEWIHGSIDLPSSLLKYGDQSGSIDILPYNPENIHLASDGSVTEVNIGQNVYAENKFSKTTWFDFFEDFVMPSINSNVSLNKVVNAIDYGGETITVSCEDGTIFTGEKVIITIPVKQMQNEAIAFTPSLDTNYTSAFNSMPMPDGIKMFVEFSEDFYPDILLNNGFEGATEKTYYDIAFKKESTKNIFGLFSVGEPSSEFTSLPDDDARIAKMINELDELYNGKASETYVKHLIQNWSAEPFIGGSYSFYDNGFYDLQTILREPISNKLYFAGEALSIQNSSTVHGAAENGTEVAENIIKGG